MAPSAFIPPAPGAARRATSVVVDLGLTVGTFLGAFFGARSLSGFWGTYVVVTALVAAAAMALLNRVILQRVSGGSVGKLLTDLVVVDRRTGRRPTVGPLVWSWFCTVVVFVALLGDGSDGIGSNPFPAVVRRGDAKRVTGSLPEG